MTKLIRVCVVVLAVAVLTMVATSGVALAADEAAGHAATSAAGVVGTFKFPAVAAIAAGLIIIGAGFGIGWIGSRAVESMARQPELAGQIQMAMILAAALIEGAALFALAICILCVL